MEGQTTTDLKLKVIEHIVAQYDDHKTNDVVQNILAETKIGAWRKVDLPKILKTILSTN